MADNKETAAVREDEAAETKEEQTRAEQTETRAAEAKAEVEADAEGTIGSEFGDEVLEPEATKVSDDPKDKSSDAYHAKVTAKAGTPAGLATGLVKELRPKQWVKNVLVLAAPFASGRLLETGVLLDAVLAFVVFSMAASGIYFINDAIDVDADRQHPTKRNRPIAAGLIPLPIAWVVAVLLLGGSLLISAFISFPLVVVMAVYIGVQLGYCFGLKHQPVIDLCIVASGFLLRLVAGGAAAELAISQWFLLVTAFGSLFMVAGKRYAEVKLALETGAKIRKSLKAYSPSYLRFVWAISAAITIMSFALWAYDIREIEQSRWGLISIVPFVIAMLRYAVDVDRGVAGEPEEVALKDKVLLVLGVILAGFLFLAFYL
ncbi:decaprenyl-phosphate phosphoribosyltransferase [Saccharopolyspora erythraea NRRL 2338]|uniref:Possible 4-hydroxybenzoate polyprenyltransferase n=2 Tax=Saccharopolyspora erythraea TaxID=1836 RepID=A4F646_SACEN|nr:decaprenyl-phosphate phosphoribosyltransferase [Saccharopolyspora erythraea]EQD88019.1 phosphoribose diphosphate:decaprenyl-phosphate phosphoribosyltransferase [Saccharopolyspora erythraea D]PFG93319.1 decaprenyl-phosphate phosphoribosyltransferase [Saccharopolyspora erythraea NRRL 2338]QRK90161.1 decaprenyl-phosphate phosphoribosyltransferase [Saccharopolyspora erythraea]CAL99520.1 possible 4-hydroxybenzoate polyprenyltransferase [Saccharopolyspora erythraea NRRL 2338]